MSFRRDKKEWNSYSVENNDYRSQPSSSYREYGNQRGKRGMVNNRRVSFKPQGKRNDNISKAYLKSRLGEDEEMADCNVKKDKSRRVNSPIPPEFRNSAGWYQIQIPYGQKYDKNVIISSILRAMSPELFIPLYWKQETTRSIFYVDDCKVADKLERLNRTIRMPDGFKLIIKVRPAVPTVQMDDALKERMKIVMSKRYNLTTKALDMSKFYADDGLEGVFCGLSRPAAMSAAIDIMAENVPDLEALNLNDNSIIQCDLFKIMATKLKSLKILYLDKNKISSAGQLNALKDIQLIELAIKQNPFSKHYRSDTAYISDMRRRFPKLRKLDGEDLQPVIGFEVMDPVDLPSPQASFFIDASGVDIVKQFIQQYYAIFDSNNRQSLYDAYHDQAMLSVCAGINQNRLAHYAPFSRNLKSLDQKIKNRSIRYGKLSCMSLLIDLPKTQHDLQSFTVDVTLFTPKIIAFTITGVFKEIPENSTSSTQHEIRAFQRTFIIVPYGSGYCIRNEMLLICNVTFAQLKSAFKSADNEDSKIQPSTSTLTSSTSQVPVVMDESHKLQMVRALSEQSKMNLEWSKRCLDEMNWNYDGAVQAFNELHKQNKIPAEAFVK